MKNNVHRKITAFLIVILVLIIPLSLYAGGSMESSSTGAINYNATAGFITKPEHIDPGSIIASVDYRYPDPAEDVGIYLYSGNRQISQEGGDHVFVVGIQGAHLESTELPPMNLCFVIDHSGSMSGDNQMEWVKDSFDVFLETVRETDFVSVVKFDDAAEVVFPSTRMNSTDIRDRFYRAVQAIEPEGGTNLTAGLQAGYREVMTNFREEYTNRVLFLTDGQGESEGMMEMAESFAEMDINVSTIGLGLGFNEELLREVAKAGSGTSRFIADRETMQEVFGTGLSRLVVPIVRNLKLAAQFPGGTRVTGVWAYEEQIEENRVTFSYPAVHVGDYETVVIRVELPELGQTGERNILELSGSYTTMSGQKRQLPAKKVTVRVIEPGTGPDGYSDATVLRAGAMLNYAEALHRIGELYFGGEDQPDKTSPDFRSRIEQAFTLAMGIKKELYSAQERLEFDGFKEEIEVIEAYIGILGRDMQYTEERLKEAVADREPERVRKEQSFPVRMESMFEELALSMKDRPDGPLVVTGFSFKDDRQSPILDVLTSTAETSLLNRIGLPVVSRQDLEKVMEEQKLSLSDLFETENAIAIGQILSARYMITGTVIEMNSSVIIFSRIIDIESAEILGAVQIIVEKDEDVKALL